MDAVSERFRVMAAPNETNEHCQHVADGFMAAGPISNARVPALALDRNFSFAIMAPCAWELAISVK